MKFKNSVSAASTHSPEIAPLAQTIDALQGVGRARAELFHKLDIRTIEDLLLHRPRRYEDRRNMAAIADLQPGQTCMARGTIIESGVKWFGRRTKSIFQFILDDGTGRLYCRWFNQPFLEKQYSRGQEVVVFGKVKSGKPRAMDHPETEAGDVGEDSSIHVGRIVPVYPLTEGMGQRWLRTLAWRTLQDFSEAIDQRWGGSLALTMSAARGAKGEHPLFLKLTCAEAVRLLHFPERIDQAEPVRQRLALEEFMDLQRGIQVRRQRFEQNAQPLKCVSDNRLIKPFLGRLGFKLTDAQTSVLRELRHDMNGAHPMRRLLQGDVGSGKTVVAACSALMAIESGYSVALMAPTEILAEQHCRNFRKWFEPLGIPVQIWTGSRKDAGHFEPPGKGARPTMRKSGPPGEGSGPAGVQQHPGISIGTHALIENAYAPGNLGLVIIDEQHRFGVGQRDRLLKKGRYPHLLVMTATPIPRTLGLTLYGELDVSTISSLPPGRGSIKTFVRQAKALPQVWEFIRAKLKEGRQVYVVYPRVDEDEQGGLKAVTREFESIQKQLAPYRAGLLHGRLGSEHKDSVMKAFRDNQLQLLLATSLIEVGVDVPNATVMLIENAEQFGLAQLHQLRGRIGRGAHDSYCILVSSAETEVARQRLSVLEKTNNGFEIAEADLQLRGPGELLGQKQSGLPNFRFGDLARDLELLKLARRIVSA